MTPPSRWFLSFTVLLLSAAALAQQNPYPTGCNQFITHTEYCNDHQDGCRGSLDNVIDFPNGSGQFDAQLDTLMCSNSCSPGQPGCTACQNYPSYVVMINNPLCAPPPPPPTCSGNPSFTCCGGGNPTCTNGSWSCGGCSCLLSGPYPIDCTQGQATECTSGGWECVNLPGTPVVIDTDGSGFHLTSAANGVRFDLSGDGKPTQISWTAQWSRNGWLALPAADGSITSGKQLFGNFTPQPESDHPNGFLALAVYDHPDHGGNGDGVIDWRDAIWPKLRVWIDSNHDGVAQPNELYMLPSLGINSLGLSYVETPFKDQYGNRFRYKARVNPGGQPKTDPVDRVMYDVFLVPYVVAANWDGSNRTAPQQPTKDLLIEQLR